MPGEAPAVLGSTGEPEAVEVPGWLSAPGCAETPGCADTPGCVDTPGWVDVPGEVDTPVGCATALACRVPCKGVPSLNFNRVGTSTGAARYRGEAAYIALPMRDTGMMPSTCQSSQCWKSWVLGPARGILRRDSRGWRPWASPSCPAAQPQASQWAQRRAMR